MIYVSNDFKRVAPNPIKYASDRLKYGEFWNFLQEEWSKNKANELVHPGTLLLLSLKKE